MKIRLDYLSVSVAGDYYQVMFQDKEEDEGDEILDIPCVLIQRLLECLMGAIFTLKTMTRASSAISWLYNVRLAGNSFLFSFGERGCRNWSYGSTYLITNTFN